MITQYLNTNSPLLTHIMNILYYIILCILCIHRYSSPIERDMLLVFPSCQQQRNSLYYVHDKEQTTHFRAMAGLQDLIWSGVYRPPHTLMEAKE